jgi:hypothetical protein
MHSTGDFDECFRESVDQMIDAALESENPRLWGIDHERLQQEGQVRLNFKNHFSVPGFQFSDFLPFVEGNFGTSSGKADGAQAWEFPLELFPAKPTTF